MPNFAFGYCWLPPLITEKLAVQGTPIANVALVRPGGKEDTGSAALADPG